MSEGEGPALTWVREYNAQTISLDELAERIAGHDFKPRRAEGEPRLVRAIDYKDADYEGGTFDDVLRAQAYGLLTKQDMETITARIDAAQKNAGKAEPDHVCRVSAAPENAPVIELPAVDQPYLLKVDEGYLKIRAG